MDKTPHSNVGPEQNDRIPARMKKKQIRTNMACVIIASMSFLVGLSCLDGTVLTLLAIKLGAQEFFIGLLSFILAGAILCSLPAISVMERFGKKKVLMTGFAAAAIFIIPLFCLPVTAERWAPYASLGILLAATLLRAVSNAVGGVGWFPIIQDFVPTRITGTFFANLRTYWQSAWLVSLLLLAYFLRNDEPQWWRFQCVFAIGLIAYTVRFFIIIPMSQKPPADINQKRPAIIERFKTSFVDPSIRTFIFYIFFYLAAASMAEPFTIKLLKDIGYGYAFILSATAACCIGAIISLRFWGKLADRFGNRSIFSISHIGMILVALMWLLVERSAFGSVLVFVLYFVSSVFNSGNGIAQTRYMLHTVPADKQYLMNIIQFISGAALAFGPLIAGLFLSKTKSLSFSSGAITVNNYHILFIFTACLFTIPHALRKKLRLKKETPTVQVLTIVARPIRNSLGPFLSIKLKRPDKNDKRS